MLCQRGVPKGTPFSFRNSCERDWGGKSGTINRKREKGEITALSDLLNVKSPYRGDRPKSSAIRTIAYIEKHNIYPGGRLFRIWDENSHCYCTGIIYQEKKSRFYITALRRGVRREKKQHRRLVKRSGYGKGADERRFRQVLCVFPI